MPLCLVMLASCAGTATPRPAPRALAPAPTYANVIADWHPDAVSPPPHGWIAESPTLDAVMQTVPAEILEEFWESAGEGVDHCYRQTAPRPFAMESLREPLTRAGLTVTALEQARRSGTVQLGSGFFIACFRHDPDEARRLRSAFLEGLPGMDHFRDLIARLPEPVTVRYTTLVAGRRGADVLYDLDAPPADLERWLDDNHFEPLNNAWTRIDGELGLEVADTFDDPLRFSLRSSIPGDSRSRAHRPQRTARFIAKV